MARRVRVELNGETMSLVIGDDDVVHLDHAAFRMDQAGPGMYRASDGTRQWMVAVAGPPDDRWVFVDGCVAHGTVAGERDARRPAPRAVDGAMMAPMPATVVKVLVEAGTEVARGDTLIVLEAMKMELAVRAPRDGVVRAVRCAPGAMVQPGTALVELE